MPQIRLILNNRDNGLGRPVVRIFYIFVTGVFAARFLVGVCLWFQYFIMPQGCTDLERGHAAGRHLEDTP